MEFNNNAKSNNIKLLLFSIGSLGLTILILSKFVNLGFSNDNLDGNILPKLQTSDNQYSDIDQEFNELFLDSPNKDNVSGLLSKGKISSLPPLYELNDEDAGFKTIEPVGSLNSKPDFFNNNLDFELENYSSKSMTSSIEGYGSSVDLNNSRLKLKQVYLRNVTQLIYSLIKQSVSSPKQQLRLTSAIVSESKKNDLDPFLVTALIRAESGFNHKAISVKGGMGLMQIRTENKRFIESYESVHPEKRKSLYHPEYNIYLGIRYFKYLKRKFKNSTSLALIAYNWGPENLEKIIKFKKRKKQINDLVPYPVLKYVMVILESQSRWHSEIAKNL